MSIAAWPSIEPAIPRSACARASRTRRSRSSSRNSTASSTIITGPPTNSARVNCQPISRARITPSSITRLVEAISNAIAAVKLAPFRNSDRASATAAYEQDEDAAPKAAASASVRGRSSPRSRTIVDFLTTAWITADNPNPRISAQVISHVIDPVMDSACTMARISPTSLGPERACYCRLKTRAAPRAGPRPAADRGSSPAGVVGGHSCDALPGGADDRLGRKAELGSQRFERRRGAERAHADDGTLDPDVPVPADCRGLFDGHPGGHRWDQHFVAILGRLAVEQLPARSEEHTSELQSQSNLVCRLLL